MSKIREALSKDERLEEAAQYDKIFLGACCGVGLKPRGPGDNHIVFVQLMEDDEFWFISKSGCSSHWAPEIVAANQAAIAWCEKNALPDISNGIQYGWRFKD